MEELRTWSSVTVQTWKREPPEISVLMGNQNNGRRPRQVHQVAASITRNGGVCNLDHCNRSILENRNWAHQKVGAAPVGPQTERVDPCSAPQVAADITGIGGVYSQEQCSHSILEMGVPGYQRNLRGPPVLHHRRLLVSTEMREPINLGVGFIQPWK